jgi:hypothetical protein
MIGNQQNHDFAWVYQREEAMEQPCIYVNWIWEGTNPMKWDNGHTNSGRTGEKGRTWITWYNEKNLIHVWKCSHEESVKSRWLSGDLKNIWERNHANSTPTLWENRRGNKKSFHVFRNQWYKNYTKILPENKMIRQ